MTQRKKTKTVGWSGRARPGGRGAGSAARGRGPWQRWHAGVRFASPQPLTRKMVERLLAFTACLMNTSTLRPAVNTKRQLEYCNDVAIPEDRRCNPTTARLECPVMSSFAASEVLLAKGESGVLVLPVRDLDGEWRVVGDLVWWRWLIHRGKGVRTSLPWRHRTLVSPKQRFPQPGRQ